MRRVLRAGLLLGILATLFLVGCQNSTLVRIYRQMTLFDEGRIIHNFQNMNELFATSSIPSGAEVFDVKAGSYALPESFEHEGTTFETESFLAGRQTTGVLILHDGRLMYESYANGHSVDSTHIAWSVSKSFVSALVGIAIDEGHIESIDQPVTHYVPELAGSGYDGVALRDVLQMSSGVGFNEDYGDPDSDINRMGEALALGESLLDFSKSLERVRPPGTLLHYVSIDTQVLGLVLVRATGQSLTDYSSEKLWRPMEMSPNAYWMVDEIGMEMAFGGLNATLRDFARFGTLYLNGGRWNGKQIVPEAWVKESTTPHGRHVQPGPKADSEETMGYGYQWWLPADWDNDFVALGVYSQMIYIDPTRRLVVALQSANRDFQRDDFEPTREALSLWRKVGRELGGR